jgi:hypothetical protein
MSLGKRFQAAKRIFGQQPLTTDYRRIAGFKYFDFCFTLVVKSSFF